MTVPEGTNAFHILEDASQENPCYRSNSIYYNGLGNYITGICCLEQDSTKGFYWFIYVNNSLSPDGVDGTIPKNGDTISFRYCTQTATCTTTC